MAEGQPKPRIPMTSQIVRAEQERAAGGYDYARDQVAGIIGFPLDNFSRRELPQQQRFLTAARISASSSISWAREQWNAPAVAEKLTQARRVIVDIYDHPEVQTAARKVKTGINNEPYEYLSEMRRDRFAYTLTLAALTGNTELLTTVITEMDTAIAEAEEPIAKTLLQFEQQRLRQRQTPTDESFAALTTAFTAATEASLKANNMERAATISARYILDAEDHQGPTELTKAHVLYDRATRDNDAIVDILPRERVKKQVERNKQLYWQTSTPEGVDYSELALP